MTQRDEFDSASGSFVAMKDLVGELVLFTPHEHIQEITTTFSKDKDDTKDAVRTDLVVLTQGCEAYEDVLVFQGSLIGSLKRKIPGGRKLLGRIIMGEAKKGQSAPYKLAAPSEADEQMARDYLAGRVVASATPESDDPFAA